MQSEGSIFIAGHSGLAGSAILRALQSRGYSRLIVRAHQELELTALASVNSSSWCVRTISLECPRDCNARKMADPASPL